MVFFFLSVVGFCYFLRDKCEGALGRHGNIRGAALSWAGRAPFFFVFIYLLLADTIGNGR